MAVSITVRPDKMLPLRTKSGIEYVALTDTYAIHLKGLTRDETIAMLERIDVPPEQLNTEPDAPPLPREFQRRLEID